MHIGFRKEFSKNGGFWRKGRGAGVACIPSAGLLCRGEWQGGGAWRHAVAGLSLEKFTHFESFIRGEGGSRMPEIW